MAAKTNTAPSTAVKTEAKKKKKKGKNKTAAITEELAKSTISEPEQKKETQASSNKSQPSKKSVANNIAPPAKPSGEQTSQPVAASDPQKRLKNLRKKMREIETLEEKIKTGLLKNPEKEILEKLTRKAEITKEIKRLEASQ